MVPSRPAAQQGKTVLTLQDFLHREHQEGRLLPWLRRATRDAFLVDQARLLGLGVEDEELQRAVDFFRRSRDLTTADATHAWLKEQRLTQDDLEAAIERRLLITKLKLQVGRAAAPQRFQDRMRDYDRLRLRLILVPREDLARELLMQLTEEGADFGALAQSHSQHPSKSTGGQLGRPFRVQLPSFLREALAEAIPGALVGPIVTAEGCYLVAVEEANPAAWDDATAAFIHQQLYQEWLAEQLAGAEFVPLLLDALQ
jgi:peptidyl-prolyl cis-trans isomerase C